MYNNKFMLTNSKLVKELRVHDHQIVYCLRIYLSLLTTVCPEAAEPLIAILHPSILIHGYLDFEILGKMHGNE